jgi:hypothetical protein
MTEAELLERDREIIRLADEVNADDTFKYTWPQITEIVRRRWPLGKPPHKRSFYNRYVELTGYTRERVRDQRRIHQAAGG